MTTDSGWLIHKRPQGDSSLYLTLFTAEHGLIRALYKGARNLKKKSALQGFVPLWLEWTNRQEYFFIRRAELQNSPLQLNGTALICAMYVNELIYLCLKQPEASPDLYANYEYTLMELEQCTEPAAMSIILRQFEWALLHHCGAGFPLTTDIHSDPIDSNKFYQFLPQSGFVSAPNGIPGHCIIAIRNNQLAHAEVLQVAKQVMRSAIDDLVDYKPLQSRKLLTTRQQPINAPGLQKTEFLDNAPLPSSG